MLNFLQRRSKKTLSSNYSTHSPKSQPIKSLKHPKPRKAFQFGRSATAVIFAVFAIFSASGVINLNTTNTASATGVISTNSFSFKDFTADYYLSRDTDGTSRLKVVENLTAVFPEHNQNHGITRVIPFTNNDGRNLTMKSDHFLHIDVLRNGEHEPVAKTEVGDGYFTVYIGDKYQYVHGEQKYTLTYEYENVILDQSDGNKIWQELYWDTNGNDWQQEFGKVTARIHFDKTSADNYDQRHACYVGRYGSTNTSRCATRTIEDGIEFSAQNLAPRENLTFVLGFNAGTFIVPEPRRSYFLLITTIIVAILALSTILISLLIYRGCRDKRQFYKSMFVKPEYTPPKGYMVAEMAANYIGKAHLSNPKVATLLELAVTHKIEIIKATTVTVFGREKDVWKIKVLDADLTCPQKLVLKILAKSQNPLEVGQEITITVKTSTTATTLSKLYDKELKKIIEASGFTEPKQKTRWCSIVRGSIMTFWTLLVFVGMVIIAGAIDTDKSYIEIVGGSGLMIVIFLLAVIVLVFSSGLCDRALRYYQHTKSGLEISRYLDGLYLYIKMAEADRIKFLQSTEGADVSATGVVKLYEKLLPYATLFGLEDSWLKEMGKYYEMKGVSEPSWYVGTGVFSAHEFSRAMRSMSSSASSSISHSSTSGSSSSGSGFSGGSSGGGGGGGGGGGW